MDALDALEAATGNSSQKRPASQAAAALADGVLAASADRDTPRKRSRSLLGVKRERPSPASCKKQKAEESDDDGAGLEDVKGNGDPDDPADKHDKNCLGCGRNALTGTCFHDTTTAITWALPNFKGSYCKDCFTCWRTCMSQEYTLYLFGMYLQEAANYQAWSLLLMAYLSLKFEGAQVIKNHMVLERKRTLAFVLKMMGLLPGPFVISLLDGSEKQEESGNVMDSKLLVTVLTAEGSRLGLMQPMVLMDEPTTIPRPPGADGAPVLLQRDRLSTTLLSDHEWLSDHFGVAPPEGASASTSLVPVEDSQNQKSKLAQRFDGIKRTVLAVIQMTQTESWQDLKESQFTKILTQLTSVHSEASTTAEGTVIDEAAAWVQGVAAGKAFAKGYREYGRCKDKHEKLKNLYMVLHKYHTFLTETARLKVVVSFQLLTLKASYLHRAAEEAEQPAATALKMITEEGVN